MKESRREYGDCRREPERPGSIGNIVVEQTVPSAQSGLPISKHVPTELPTSGPDPSEDECIAMTRWVL